ncbi:MAG TPA: acid phosphatase [Acetobacteraceae bacterium]|nr:acid phosphatase [Acetobacteraceae bacterium]
MISRLAASAAAFAAFAAAFPGPAFAAAPNYNDIQTVVVIYAENRSFDNLYGTFPGANGLAQASKTSVIQLDRDGKPMRGLPAVWGGMSARVPQGAPQAPTNLTQGQTQTFLGSFNHPYNVAALYKSVARDDSDPLAYTNRDLYHRFYENQMQINHGANNMFAAWADSGGLTMGYFSPAPARERPLWKWAHQYVLADNFFQGGFGGSFFNHFYLICSCAPYYGHDGINPNGGTNPSVSAVEPDGVTLTPAANSPASALQGPPVFKLSGNLTPDFYAINTMQPPYPPSANALKDQPPGQGVDLKSATTLVRQTQPTIGDLLSQKGIDWAYYAGAWNFALTHPPGAAGISNANPNFQYHHQPFNYFAAFDPATPEGQANRAAHLRDAGVTTGPDKLADSRFLTDIRGGTLPPVTFYKPQGTFNEHPGYASIMDGDRHIAAVLTALKASPQWKHMLVVVTYDEFGGWWDHVAPPKADRFGPGTRVPALIISNYARKGTVDHTLYDTTSIIRFISNKWKLPVLPGIAMRDAALAANHEPGLGDLTGALLLN